MIGRNCIDREHSHCSGVVKFADPADGLLDVSVRCECACHWETECPSRADKQHCDCWYDGEACCACDDPADVRGGQAR